jgi:Ribbon-helix-helix protein, copG family
MLYTANMKAVQVSMDEGLLARLDADEEVKRDGRSAVLRRAADLYLRQRRSRAIAAAYERAYRGAPDRGGELEGWAGEGSWPDR